MRSSRHNVPNPPVKKLPGLPKLLGNEIARARSAPFTSTSYGRSIHLEERATGPPWMARQAKRQKWGMGQIFSIAQPTGVSGVTRGEGRQVSSSVLTSTTFGICLVSGHCERSLKAARHAACSGNRQANGMARPLRPRKQKSEPRSRRFVSSLSERRPSGSGGAASCLSEPRPSGSGGAYRANGPRRLRHGRNATTSLPYGRGSEKRFWNSAR
jgi:hypothetical protein